MTTEELKSELEIARMLYHYCLTVRRTKKRPELAGVAAKREVEFKRQMEGFQQELARMETPALPLHNGTNDHDHHDKAA